MPTPHYDFRTVTATPSKAKRPSPPAGKPRRPGGRVLVALVAVTLAAVLVLVLLIRDGETGRGADSSQQSYCTLEVRFEELLAASGLTAPMPGDASIVGARQVLTTMGTDIDALGRSAPTAIRQDVKTVIDTLRAAERGQPDGVTSETFAQARQRMSEHGQSTCGTGAGSGDN